MIVRGLIITNFLTINLLFETVSMLHLFAQYLSENSPLFLSKMLLRNLIGFYWSEPSV
ncbi:MAG: hypothetical protein ACI82Z_001150 [Cellvibrionaceae bacterium]|jgi:hypothetical protein